MNIKETDYCIMARLEINSSDELSISDNTHIAREYAQCAGVNKFIKTYELNIHPTTDITVKNAEGYLTEYRLYLYLINKNKKIIEVPEGKIEYVKYVFNKLLEDDFDFNYENYKEIREKTFSDSINEPYVTQQFIDHYTYDSHAAEKWKDHISNDKDTADLLQKWADLCKDWTKHVDITNGRKEGASPYYTINPRETLASDIYNVRFSYDDYTGKKS